MSFARDARGGNDFSFPNFNSVSLSKADEMLISLSKCLPDRGVSNFFMNFSQPKELGKTVKEDYWGRTCVKMQMVIY